jgi:hypothetical protein
MMPPLLFAIFAAFVRFDANHTYAPYNHAPPQKNKL